MANRPRDPQPIPLVAKVFVAFCFVLVLLAVLSFWPPRSAAILAWLLCWCAICVTTGLAIGRHARYAPAAVWVLLAMAGWSAASAFRSGALRGVGILIDVVLFVPLIWFAVWYQRSRRVES